jgi:type VI secretion system protein ImpC
MSAVHIDTGLDPESKPALVRPSDDPFRIVLLGDFGGRASRNEPRLRRDPIFIDPDRPEEVMEKLGTGLALSAGGVPLTLRFRELDDFHPDHLYQTLPVFQSLRKARAELADPVTFRAAAAGPQSDPAPPPPAPFSGSLLDEIVEQTTDSSPAPLDRTVPLDLDEAIRRIVAPHVIPRAGPRQEELVAQVDSATGALMRAILGHPQFQALEAAWRSVFFLLQRLETGTQLKLYAIDITREEMLEATSSGHPQLIAREGWSVAACLHPFFPTEQDCAALASLAGLARKAGGPLLAGMHPRLMGCESMAATPDPGDWDRPLDGRSLQAWRELRAHPDARWIGLAMPRILLRLPYGRSTSAVESFEFEEMPLPPVHEAYLWGSPAIACVCLLGQAFSVGGWQFHPGLRNQLDGLPVHNYRVDGDVRMTPAAETLLTDRMADRVLEQGVMPLAASKSTGSILLVRPQSIADPIRALAGAWA